MKSVFGVPPSATYIRRIKGRPLWILAATLLLAASLLMLAKPAKPASAQTPTVPPAPTPTTLNSGADIPAGHQIIAFPQRDFISASGYGTSTADTFTVNVIRNGETVGSVDAHPVDDTTTAGFDGIVEVNHPGGSCWVGQTPDIKPGDIVRITDQNGVADQTTVANVVSEKPPLKTDTVNVKQLANKDWQVTIRGTAMGAQDPASPDAQRLPLTSLEHRLISKKDKFDFNGRRDLRAVQQGTGKARDGGVLAYDTTDPTDGHYTATYTVKTANDRDRILSAQARILWLGNDPALGNELTTYEAGEVAGPSAPCTAPLEGAGPPPSPVDPTTLGLDAPTTTTLNSGAAIPAGHQIIAFPKRDFISASGYGSSETDTFTVNVIRNGRTIGGVKANPVDDPATPEFDGLIEVNHPGGNCWQGWTPDIQAGDLVRLTDQNGVADQTVVADLSATKAAQLSTTSANVTGTAKKADGTQLPLDQIEQRLVSGKDRFANGKRTLRAPGNGTLVYDADGSINWTATYSNLSSQDVGRALAAQSRILWLGNDPLLGNEATIWEEDQVDGPQSPCDAAPMPATA
jgi:archaellum component FlaF (FlaF/FlaG flagellin family)